MNVDGYSGDYGTIVGVGTTSTGSQEQLYFDMYIPVDSFMRDAQYVGTSVTVTTLGAGDYFTVYGTNISIGNTFASEDSSGSTIGIGTTALDNVYQVISAQRRDQTVPGVGSTAISRITVNIDKPGGFAFSAVPSMGEYTWGKIVFEGRTSPQEFDFYGNSGVTGITTGGLVSRFEPLKYRDYTA